MNNERLKVALGYILICLIWGSTWIVIKIGLETMTPMFAVGLRFLIAAGVLYAIIKFKNLIIDLNPISVRLYLFLGIFSYIIPFSLVYWAEQFVPTGLTSVLFAVFPFWVILFSRIALPKGSIGIFKVIGVGLGFIGITIIFWNDISFDFEDQTLGMLAVILSAIMQAFVIVIVKKYGKELHPISMNFYPLLITGVILIPVALVLEDSTRLTYSHEALFSILYLSTIGSVVAFTVYYWLLKRINAVILSLSSFITPIAAIILGWIILDERLNFNHFIGSSLVLIGILFANFKGFLNYYKETHRTRNV
ncbi:MAG: DMT family transporter [Bacteroidota bacterium]